MAEKNVIDRVKELIDSNANASLKEAAQKWLDDVDAKYGDKIDMLKEKGGETLDKLGEMADKYTEKSIEANEKFAEVSEKLAAGAEKLADKAAPVVEDLKEKAAPKFEELKDKAAPKVEELKGKAAPKVEELKGKAAPKVEELKGKAAPVVDKVVESEFIKQLKAGIASLDEVIETFSKPEMKDKVGEEAAEQIRKHAEAMKAEGKTFCDCPACTKAREILRDLGEDIDVPEAE